MLPRSNIPAIWRSLSLWAVFCALCAPLGGWAQVSPFSFTPQSGVAPGTLVTSNAIQVSTGGPVSISIVGGEYSVAGAAFTSAAGIIQSCQTVTVRLMSSSSFSTTTNATLTIGGVTGAFTVTTAAADTTPNAFSFATQTGVALSTPTLSNAVTVSGINTAAPISVTGGEYRINSGAFTTAAGTVNPSDTVAVRVTSASTYATTTQARLTIGGVAGSFNVTTLAEAVSALTFSTTTLNFSQPALGSTSAAQSVIVRNAGTAAIAMDGVSLAGAASADFSQTNNCGSSLAAGASCAVAVTFTPSASGTRLAEVAFTTTPSTSTRIALIGMRNAGPANDVNGDGRSDVIWRHSATGEVVVWPMNGLTLAGNALLVSAASNLGWEIAGSGDFNGDGRSDILWRNTATRDLIVWLMNGGAVQASGLVGRPSRSWRIAGTGDFNGDGRADILLRNPSTGANTMWFMNGTTRQATASVSKAGSSWQVAGTGDFNGDGKSDLLWRHSIAGDVVVWIMNGAIRQNAAPVDSVADLGWQIVGTGDFNGDGRSELLWRHRVSGNNQIWLLNGVTLVGTATVNTVADLSWAVEGTGDYNGDGKCDILWRHQVSGNSQVWLLDGSAVTSTGSLPAVPDLGWVVAP